VVFSSLVFFRAFCIFRGRNPFTTETRRRSKREESEHSKKRKPLEGVGLSIVLLNHSFPPWSSLFSPRPRTPSEVNFSSAILRKNQSNPPQRPLSTQRRPERKIGLGGFFVSGLFSRSLYFSWKKSFHHGGTEKIKERTSEEKQKKKANRRSRTIYRSFQPFIPSVPAPNLFSASSEPSAVKPLCRDAAREAKPLCHSDGHEKQVDGAKF